MSSAKTIAKPALLPTWSISSTGSNEMMPKADKIPHARPHHRNLRLKRVRIDDGCYGVRRVVKSIDELEAQGDQQCDPEEQELKEGLGMYLSRGDVAVEAIGRK
jgi:hypothetical protein